MEREIKKKGRKIVAEQVTAMTLRSDRRDFAHL